MRYVLVFSFCIFPFITTMGQGLLGRGNPVRGEKDSINIYLNFQDIWGLDFKEGAFSANFYTVMKSQRTGASRLQYLNEDGKIENKYFDTTRKLYYEAWNIGRFLTTFNFKDYPLDKQHLHIVVEAGEDTSKTVLFSLAGQSSVIGKPHLAGWKIDTITVESSVHTYKRFNQRDALYNHQYSRITFTVVVERLHKWGFLFKLFFPSFISMLILMIGFLFSAEKVDTRFGLGVASIFGVISSLIVIQQKLPDMAGLTLVDILNYIAIITVFATLIIFSISFNRSKKKKNTRKFERISFVALMLFYIVSNLLILFLRS